jgi:hypothetical protein
MAKKLFPLSKVYSLLEPGPVVMVTTAGKVKMNIMTMSWHRNPLEPIRVRSTFMSFYFFAFTILLIDVKYMPK